jgi:hypothetical protein
MKEKQKQLLACTAKIDEVTLVVGECGCQRSRFLFSLSLWERVGVRA